MYFIIAIIIFAVFYYLIVVRQGNLSFWKKASKNPDYVHEQLSKDQAWLIDDSSVKIDKKEYDGPFMLYVPSLGKTIKYYGKIGEYEESQKRIEKRL